MPTTVLNLPRIALPQVTLLAVTSVALGATARAIEQSLKGIDFGAVLWISDQPPPIVISSRVQWERISALRGRDDYSRFMLRELPPLITTDFALCVQWDGHVLDPSRWNSAFLDNDYIGAVWPHFEDEMVVGNGGFSLRSRRLLEVCAGLPDANGEPEDTFICRTMRPRLERDHGIRFASSELAQVFSHERMRTTVPAFGFHGAFNLVRLVSDREAASLIAELPPHGLAPNELREILRWSLCHGRVRLAAEIVRRWRRWV